MPFLAIPLGAGAGQAIGVLVATGVVLLARGTVNAYHLAEQSYLQCRFEAGPSGGVLDRDAESDAV